MAEGTGAPEVPAPEGFGVAVAVAAWSRGVSENCFFFGDAGDEKETVGPSFMGYVWMFLKAPV